MPLVEFGISLDKERDIVSLYLGGFDMGDIAEKTGISVGWCKHALISCGTYGNRSILPEDRDWRADYGDASSFFQNFSTDSQCYVLGWLIADGAVGRYGLQTKVSKVDAAHLTKIAIAIGSGHQVQEYIEQNHNLPGGRVIKNYPYARLYIGQYGVGDALRDIGFDGSIHNMQPNSKLFWFIYNLPSELRWSVLRGLFDGDGGICKTSPVCYFSGTFPLVDLVRTIIWEETKLNSSIGRGKADSGISYYGKNAARLVHRLYLGASIYLDRKKKLAEMLLCKYPISFN